MVFWNKKENCGNDTELGKELFEYIDNQIEEKSGIILSCNKMLLLTGDEGEI